MFRRLADSLLRGATQRSERKFSFAQLKHVLYPERFILGGAFLALGVSQVGSLSFPMLAGKMVDSVLESKGDVKHSDATDSSSHTQATEYGHESLLSWVNKHIKESPRLLGSAAIGLLIVGSGARIVLLDLASERLQRRLRLSYFKGLISSDHGRIRSFGVGDLMSRLTVDVGVLSSSLFGVSMLLRGISASGVSVYMLLTSVPGSLASAVVGPIVGMSLLLGLYSRAVRSMSKARLEKIASSNKFVQDRLANIDTVKLFRGEAKDVERYGSQLDGVFGASKKLSIFNGSRVGLVLGCGAGVALHLLHTSTALVASGVLTPGQTGQLAGYALLASNGLQTIFSAIGDFQRAASAGERLSAVDPKIWGSTIQSTRQAEETLPHVNLVSSSESKTKKNKPTSDSLLTSPVSVHIENLSLTALDGTRVLNDLSLTIPAGARVLLVGPSGSGKSTLLNILGGLTVPTSGTVKFHSKGAESKNSTGVESKNSTGGEDSHSKGIEHDSSRPSGVRSLTQSYNVFATESALGNIFYPDSYSAGPRNSEFRRGSNAAAGSGDLGAASFKDSEDLVELKNGCSLGFLTETAAGNSSQSNSSNKNNSSDASSVSSEVTSLSGGQRQRICLARAIHKNPSVLLLDEPTSALDPATEAHILAFLKKETKRTVIMASHKLAAIDWSTHLVVLQKGSVLQSGTTKSVLAQPCSVLKQILSIQPTD